MGVPNVQCTPIATAKTSVGGVDLGLGIIGLVGFLVAGILTGMSAIGLAGLTPATLAIWAVAMIASCLMVINLINKAMDVLFHYKLACIDGERCAVGKVMKIELNPDGDTTLALQLAPVEATTTVAQFKASAQGASLVYSDPGTASRGWVFNPSEGNGNVSEAQPIPLLHCEIKGSYLNDWLSGLLVLLWTLIGIATAAIALAATMLIPVIGWIIWAVMALIALFSILLGIHMSGGGEDQSNTQPDVPVKDQLPGSNGPVLTDSNNDKVAIGDYVMLSGMHVLDCGHAEDKHDDGTPKGTWCEIHPVRAIAKVDQAFYDNFSAGTNFDLADRYCAGLKAAAGTDGRTATAQQPLEHRAIG